jgi:hypothetical protein
MLPCMIRPDTAVTDISSNTLPVISGTCFRPRAACRGSFLSTAALVLIFWVCWYLFQWAAIAFLAFALLGAQFTLRRRLTLFIAACLNAGAFFMIENRFLAPGNAVRPDSFLAWPYHLTMLIAWVLFIALIMYLRPGRITGASGAPLKRLATDFVLVAVLAAAVAVWARNDPLLRDVRATARTVHHLQNKQWDEICADDFSNQFKDFPEKYGTLERYLIHARNRSLAETGRLGEKMFYFPQARPKRWPEYRPQHFSSSTGSCKCIFPLKATLPRRKSSGPFSARRITIFTHLNRHLEKSDECNSRIHASLPCPRGPLRPLSPA